MTEGEKTDTQKEIFTLSMARLLIHTVDKDPEVRTVSADIAIEDIAQKKWQQYFDDLIEAMIRYNGIGIASCQVGRNIRVIVISKEYTKDAEHTVMINPRLVSTSARTTLMEEGCLSVPKIYGPVKRFTKVRVKGWYRDGRPFDIKAKGMLARIFQHELDHLEGTLFIDTAVRLERVEQTEASHI